MFLYVAGSKEVVGRVSAPPLLSCLPPQVYAVTKSVVPASVTVSCCSPPYPRPMLLLITFYATVHRLSPPPSIFVRCPVWFSFGSRASRYESLKHCKWVDEVVEDAPWVVDEAFVAAHQVRHELQVVVAGEG